MRTAMTVLALLTLAAASGCKKKPAERVETGSGSALGSSTMGSSAGSATGSAEGSAGSGSGSGAGADAGSAAMGSGAGSGDAAAMAHHAGNCPSTVLGATTKAELKGKDVIVTITSADKVVIAAIQKRTDELLQDKSDKKEPSAAHDQKGSHGGGVGLCPVYVPESATAKAKHDKTGVAVTITAKAKPDELKTEIDARIVKAADWVKANIAPGAKGNQGGVGGGSGNDGMNHSGSGDAKGIERKKGRGKGAGGGGGKGTGGGGAK